MSESAKARVGDTVLVRGIMSNGREEHPAIVTNVFESGINVKIFVDNGPVIDRYTVPFFATRDSAIAHEVAQHAAPVFSAFPLDNA